jgi:hypothetical protein
MYGGKWRWALHVSGFRNEGDAERFERSWKRQRQSSSRTGRRPVEAWIVGLKKVLQQQLQPSSADDHQLELHWLDEECAHIYTVQ